MAPRLVPPQLASASAAAGAALVPGGRSAQAMLEVRRRITESAARYEQSRRILEGALDEVNIALELHGRECSVATAAVVSRMAVWLRDNHSPVRDCALRLSAAPGGACSSGPVLLHVNTALPDRLRPDAVLGAVLPDAVRPALVLPSPPWRDRPTVRLGVSLPPFVTRLGERAHAVATQPPAAAAPLTRDRQVRRTRAHRILLLAREHELAVEQALEEHDALRARIDLLQDRVDHRLDTLALGVARAVAALDLLEARPFDPDRHADLLAQALACATVVADLVATPLVVDDDLILVLHR